MALRAGGAAATTAACISSFIARQRNPTTTTTIRFHDYSSSSHFLHRPSSFSCRQYQNGYKHQIRAIQGINADTVTPKTQIEEKNQKAPETWKIKMLYDGDCPLCMREVDMLRERNKHYGTIKFVDISSDEYSPEDNQGLDYNTVMGRIHAILVDGTVVTDVEAFRRLYEQVGLGWVYAVTKYEPIATMADALYGVWAKYRLQITGRPPLEEILEARRKSKIEVCGDNVCKK